LYKESQRNKVKGDQKNESFNEEGILSLLVVDNAVL
jgi:hypothetical protein